MTEIQSEILNGYNAIAEKIKSKYVGEEFYFVVGQNRLTELEELEDKVNIADDILDGFIAYCDIKAKATNSQGKSHYDNGEKRYIAEAGIRQPHFRSNLKSYLRGESNVSFGVKRAIEYFKNPTGQFNILSNEHIKKIAKYYLEKENVENFDENLKKLFDEVLAEKLYEIKISDCNRTDIYTTIIYSQRDKWDPGCCKNFNEIKLILKNNRNLILTGAPGTGKTYLAKQLAESIAKDAIDAGDNNELEKQIDFVQFHPSYDYTDFVEGLRPKSNNTDESIGFELKPGIFKEFCKKAADTDKDCVFIIDEINRGEISKIFGELFFSIDPGYRGNDGKVRTQYANMQSGTDFEGVFYVPENVFIIGTMNDIDRSVESMDFAFRRRFAFYEVEAKETQDAILSGITDKNDAIKAKEAMNSINDTLVKECNLTNAYHIGAAYFKKIELYKNQSANKWNSLWKYHLQGTLFEYFRGEPDAPDKMKKLREAYYKAVENNA